jgi:hypothetical protein
MLFLAGVVQFLCVGVLLTKEKVVHTTLSTTYVEKKQPKTPSPSHFIGRMFWFLSPDVCFPLWKYDISCIFQNNVAMFGFKITLCMTRYVER